MGMHGVYVVVDSSTASPRDNVMIGIVKDGGSGDFTEIASKDDLQTYLASVSGDWTDPDPTMMIQIRLKHLIMQLMQL